VTSPLSGQFVIRRLVLAMINLHTKFKESRITCHEDIKGNAKCERSCFEPPFGDLGVTNRVHLWLDWKRIVDLQLVINELYVASCHGWALVSDICRNRRFLKGWVILSADAQIVGRWRRRPQSVYGPLDRGMM